MQSRFREEEREIICLTSTFRSVIILTEKQVRANYIAPLWKRKATKKTLRQQKRAFSSL